MIDAAHAIGVRVIAEHVADEEFRGFAPRQGAELLQGFAIGRPALLARCDHDAPVLLPSAINLLELTGLQNKDRIKHLFMV